MSDITKEQVVTFIENMTVLQLAAFVKELEEKFGVSAAAPVGAVAAAGPAAAAAEELVEGRVARALGRGARLVAARRGYQVGHLQQHARRVGRGVGGELDECVHQPVLMSKTASVAISVRRIVWSRTVMLASVTAAFSSSAQVTMRSSFLM